jgi:hypothetical protein
MQSLLVFRFLNAPAQLAVSGVGVLDVITVPAITHVVFKKLGLGPDAPRRWRTPKNQYSSHEPMRVRISAQNYKKSSLRN